MQNQKKPNLHKYYKHIVPIFPFCSLRLINSSQTVQALQPVCLLLCTPSAAALSPDGQNPSSELMSSHNPCLQWRRVLKKGKGRLICRVFDCVK